MITVGIETSCDETAIAVLMNRKILSSVVSSSAHLHEKYGGIVPEIATRYHVEVISYILKEAVKKAGITAADIDLVSVTEGPGLIGALLVGVSFAKALSYSLGVPLIGTNHIIAHLWANFLPGRSTSPSFPFVGLVVSGGHTSLFMVKGVNDYSLLGETLDDAAGEAFDKVAKILNLGYPGGPAIEKAALKADLSGRVKFINSTSARDDSSDFSFSGIKTSVLYYVNKRGGAAKLSTKEISGIACGFQEDVCDMIVNKTIAECRRNKVRSLAVGGGVSANTRLRQKLEAEAALNGIRLFIPPINFCVDNGAMTAYHLHAVQEAGAV